MDLLRHPDPNSPHIIPAADGIYPNTAFMHYKQWDAASHSLIRAYDGKTPRQARYDHSIERKPTDAQRIGTAAHARVLQPDVFEGRYLRRPEGHPNSNAFKEAREALLIDNPFGEILKDEEFDACEAMAAEVRAHPLAASLVAAHTEVCIVWTEQVEVAGEAVPVRCKAMLDFWAPGLGIGDYKTARDATPQVWGKDCHNYRYDRQAGFYRRGARALGIGEDQFFFIVQDKEPVYDLHVTLMPDSVVQKGEHDAMRLLAIHVECAQAGVWPGYSRSLQPLIQPYWAERELDNFLAQDEEEEIAA